MGHPVEHGVNQVKAERQRFRAGGELREATAAAVQARVAELAEDVGGLENVNSRQLMLMKDAALCDLVVDLTLAELARRGTALTDSGDVLPVLKTVLAFANTKRLHLIALGLTPPREKAIDDLDAHAERLAAGAA